MRSCCAHSDSEHVEELEGLDKIHRQEVNKLKHDHLKTATALRKQLKDAQEKLETARLRADSDDDFFKGLSSRLHAKTKTIGELKSIVKGKHGEVGQLREKAQAQGSNSYGPEG